jgi:hypothetical protein
MGLTLGHQAFRNIPSSSVVDPHHFDADPDAESTYHPDADLDPDFFGCGSDFTLMRIRIQILTSQ